VEHRAIDVVAPQRDGHGQARATRDPRRHVPRVHGADAVHQRMAMVRQDRARGEHEQLERLVGLVRAAHAMDRDAVAFLQLDTPGRAGAGVKVS
jgi:hypothetical protein